METPPLRERLTSRKFWLTVAVALLVTFGEKVGVDLDPDQLMALAGAVGFYAIGNGIQKRS